MTSYAFTWCVLLNLFLQISGNCYNSADITVLQVAGITSPLYEIGGIANKMQCQKLCWYTTGCHSVMYTLGSKKCALSLHDIIPIAPFSPSTQPGCKNMCERRPCPFGYSCVPEGFSNSFNCFNLIGFSPVADVEETTPPMTTQPVETTSTESTHIESTEPSDGGFVQLTGLQSRAKLIGDPRENRHTAQTKCEEMGASLLMLDTMEKLQATTQYLRGSDIPTHSSYIFVDGYDDYRNHTYQFENGNVFNLTEAWSLVDPNSLAEQCLWIRDTGKENVVVYDGHCTSGLSYICERDG